MTKHMDMACITMQMEQSMRVSGGMTSKKGLAEKSGLTRAASKACTEMERSMAMESSYGLMEHVMKETGRQTKCMAKECLLGQMAEDTRENMKMTESTGLAFSHGLMVDATRVCGIRGNRLSQLEQIQMAHQMEEWQTIAL